MTSDTRNTAPRLFLLTVAALLAGVLLTLAAVTVIPDSLLGTQSESRDTQVINSVTREEQVVLLSLGIQGLSERNEKSQFLGMGIPGTGRAQFIQYTFNAKLGIEGRDVSITRTGDNEYVVSIPEFIFIGHSDESFRLAAEDNGLLSWVTPEIDAFDAVNNILSDEAKVQYIQANAEILQDQTRSFYTGIFTGIDPDISVRFKFPTEPR